MSIANALAHSENSHGEDELFSVHAFDVAKYCEYFSADLDVAREGRLCGLLHDIGKVGIFQKRLTGEISHVDHWSFGAVLALNILGANGVASALSIEGHHKGIGRVNDVVKFLSLSKEMDAELCRQGKNYSFCSMDEAEEWIRTNFDFEEPLSSIAPAANFQNDQTRAALMLDVRMLFSALTDADYLATEAHFESPEKGVRYARPPAPLLQDHIGSALAALSRHMLSVRSSSKSNEKVNEFRDVLHNACVEKADSEPGTFTLSAPTGYGKTLAMLSFALHHAKRNKQKRIICVLPYLNIIEQMAAEYSQIFKELPIHFCLEHHSLAVRNRNADRSDDVNDETSRVGVLLTENWDAPVVITTSVQFFESMMSNRSSACRKLHNIANSVVLFDEVQTLPAHLASVTLATLNQLSRRYRTSVVFATATQPAFSVLSGEVEKLCGIGWAPGKMIPDKLETQLFKESVRTNILWPEQESKLSWESLAEKMMREKQVLTILNMKRHVVALLDALEKEGVDDLFHLSTSMCVGHRERVLKEIRARLEDSRPCRVVATQCVEAGVDFDFPALFRAFGPLEAIAQAAGRCNRNMKDSDIKNVAIFHPDDTSGKRIYPDATYGQAAGILQNMLNESGDVNIHDPETYHRYYSSLYQARGLDRSQEGKSKSSELQDAVMDRNFPRVAELYRLIPSRSISILVPDNMLEFASLKNEARQKGVGRDWFQRARPHTVSVYNAEKYINCGVLEPVPIFGEHARNKKGDVPCSEEWFFLLDEDLYDSDLRGLKEPEEFLIG